MARTERPHCPECNRKMHTAYIRPGSQGAEGTVIIGHYCRSCRVFRSLEE